MGQQLTCSECGTAFERPGVRGPVPTRCSKCKTERRRVQHVEEERRRQERIKQGRYVCGHCQQEKSGEEFAYSQRKDGSWCRDCFRDKYVERSGGYITKNCVVCGDEFQVTRRNERQAYCKRRCKEAAYNQRKSARLLESKRGRICDGCGGEIPPERFAGARYCKDKCRDAHAGPVVRRRHSLKANYGLTPEDYDRMFAEQDGKCAICGTTEVRGFGKYLAVDHCHDSGKVRALLCGNCNRGIGAFHHDITKLQQAIEYLRRTE